MNNNIKIPEELDVGYIVRQIKRLRIENGYSQDELSKVLDINRATYMRIESGYTNPNLEFVYKLAQIYGCSIECLTKDTTVQRTVDATGLLPQQVQLIEQLIYQFKKANFSPSK